MRPSSFTLNSAATLALIFGDSTQRFMVPWGGGGTTAILENAKSDRIHCFSSNTRMYGMIKRRKKNLRHVASMEIRDTYKIWIGKFKGSKPNSATNLERVVLSAGVTCGQLLSHMTRGLKKKHDYIRSHSSTNLIKTQGFNELFATLEGGGGLHRFVKHCT